MTNNSEIDVNALVDDHSDYLLSFAMSKLKDLDLAKDLVQDTLVSAITKLETFEKRSKLRTWLTSILNRKIIDHWRKAETRYTDPVSSFFQQEGKPGHWLDSKGKNKTLETIEDQISREETNMELADCLGKLPDKWKGVVASKYLEEKDSEEICKDFEITSSNLWVIIHRAKLVLRDCLQNKWEL
ncbi:MAG: sigma-70 family RNA polymerase sigma factor [Crocinitomicaceae bacterium]|nr:sigma-70 family RNA polymerase sigma factor [Crocinitomicaceae bacterium]